jgi:hypothetical protein
MLHRAPYSITILAYYFPLFSRPSGMYYENWTRNKFAETMCVNTNHGHTVIRDINRDDGGADF